MQGRNSKAAIISLVYELAYFLTERVACMLTSRSASCLFMVNTCMIDVYRKQEQSLIGVQCLPFHIVLVFDSQIQI